MHSATDKEIILFYGCVFIVIFDRISNLIDSYTQYATLYLYRSGTDNVGKPRTVNYFFQRVQTGGEYQRKLKDFGGNLHSRNS